MQKFSYLKSSNVDYIDELFGRYQQDPASVDESWRYFFEGIELGTEEAAQASLPNGHAAPATVTVAAPAGAVDFGAEAKVVELIFAYRQFGKYLANVNPLLDAPSSHPALELSQFGLTHADLSKTFNAGRLIGLNTAKLSDILAALKATYCGSIGIELSHIEDTAAREWLLKRLESARGAEKPDNDTRKQIYSRLVDTDSFERFLHTRYVAQKRFSVEGGDAVIPAIDTMIEAAADQGATEFVFGMAHRGRLNVLTHILGKSYEQMFTEFEGTYKSDLAHGEGDVKYHKGYSKDLTTRSGKKVHLSLTPNPSHLEFVNAVVEGIARAKQDRLGDQERKQVVPVLIHGDAAFAGQGVCYETLNFVKLEGYSTGGTLHLVINNQVGFTTSPKDSRSTVYSTDVAKMLPTAPIFHVNGDDAEAVWFVAKLAADYRQKFKADVFIDIVCYRRHGHNEGDEPSFTQPLTYKKIKTHPTPREIYGKQLAQAGVMPETEVAAVVDRAMEKLTEAQKRVKAEPHQPYVSVFEGVWKGLKQPTEAEIFAPVKTAVEETTLKLVAEKINHIPKDVVLHPKLARFFEARLKAIQDGKGIDWGNGEALAYATLLREGHNVRVSGQDAERGTFTHRHSVINCFETGKTYTPLNHIGEKQGRYMVHNSHLSETGVMGFEYGYALAAPQTLTIWEAQFGDFANGAQVIIDQFVSTSESKWQRMNGLVLLLPHGYEGQGPEHSSARLERFLQLCGRNNLFVCNFTTPAQIFHALRRQVKRDFRKPMVVMSPKSLLRHPQAVSTLDEFSKGGFQEVIDDSTTMSAAEAKKVKRVILCSGKVYYDLAAERSAQKRTDIAIVRIEQLYPWPAWKLADILKRYTGAKDIVWVQEEPRNMGAWTYVFNTWAGGLANFQEQVDNRPIRFAGRDIAAAPAVGSPKIHEAQFKAYIEQAFAEGTS